MVDVGKDQVDLDSATDLAGKVRDNVKKLDTLLQVDGDENKSTLALDKVMPAIDKCSSIQSVISALEGSTQEQHQQLKNELDSNLEWLQGMVSDWGNFDFKHLLEHSFRGSAELRIGGLLLGDIKAAIVEGQLF